MTEIDNVVIIFNPNSTGDSPQLAKNFAQDIKAIHPKATVELSETAWAGHAEELAYAAVTNKQELLIVSVSGDGGYHEVVNGVLKAVNEGAQSPLCAVLPGGNANDHYSNVYDRPLMDAIRSGKTTHLDVLRISWNDQTRYAHSYIGLGLTPVVATELNRHTLSAVKETWLALKTFWGIRPFKISYENSVQTFDSFIITNVEKMAKYLTLDENGDPHDGHFKVIQWPHGHKLKLVGLLLLAMIGRSRGHTTASEITFKTITEMPMQLDGEVVKIPANTTVTVTCVSAALKTFR